MRARVAWLGLAAVAAGLVALPAPAAAAECVRVVVDYGTLSGAPAGPNTRCVNVGDDAVAAEALAGRARYKGNFLCAIDGYPESGCGDSGTQPYWSFWIWKNNRWVYASEGVATYRVSDSDGDGHPDPLGFRHHAFDNKTSPRANPSYPKPAATTKPPAAPPPRATTAPPPQQWPGSTPAPRQPGVPPVLPSGTSTAGPATASAGAPASATTTRSAVPSASATATTAAPAAGDATEPPAAVQVKPLRHKPFPWGAVLGGLVALGLIGAGVVQSKRSGTP